MEERYLHAKRALCSVLLVLLLVSTLQTAKANPVDMRTIRKVAVKFVNANAKVPLQGVEDLQLVTAYSIDRGDAAFYVFNTPNGFVIVSADDCATPILGYSEEGQFDTEDIPVQLKEYLQGFVEQIEYGIVHHLPADETVARQWELVQTVGHLTEQRANTAVEPLLTDTWHQNCYYNTLCPANPNGPCGHTLAGCGAVSFAQIMRYWGYPTTGTGTHTYTPSGYSQQTVDFGATTYDWANMPNSLSSSSTSTEINAIATLIWHCGVAIDTRYGPNGSGSDPTDIATALVVYFGYSDELSMVFRSDYSDAEWLTLMKNCLDMGRPVHYCGFNQYGGGGHGFVCDGYNTSDQLHFNFGWSGSHNGYYSIIAIHPGSYDLTFENIAIIDIHPAFTQSIALSAGWNWFSTCIEADDPVGMIQMLEVGLGENGVQIKSAESYTTYEDEEWFGDLDDEGLMNEQMYKILTTAACTVELEGLPADPANHAITINPGWNWIGFPSAQEVSVADAFAGFDAEEGDQLKSIGDFTNFEDGEWFGDIEVLVPGQGYMYYSFSNEVKTLIYQTGSKTR